MEFEENTVQTEQAEETGTPEELDTAFDGGWDDDGLPEPEEAVTTEEGSEAEEADADQQPGDEAEGDDGETAIESDETESEGDEGNPDQGEAFTLRVLGEERTVNREEVIALAQKGADYDRIHSKWDAVKDSVAKWQAYEGFLQELADSRGGDIDSLIDETRTRALMAQAEARGEKLDPAVAAAQAVRARVQATGKAEASEQRTAEEERERNDRMVKQFLAVYNGDKEPVVQATDIPQEVWDEATETGDLVGPYQRYINRNLTEEVKRLKAEVEKAKQQRKNKERTTGSMKSVGNAAARDSFDEGWDAL